MDEHGKQHAFIQLLDGKKCTATYHEFPAEQFQPTSTHFDLKLADNHFSETTLEVELPNIKGKLTFQNLTLWPKMLGAPGIMGWYGFVPFMQCYHGVVSLHHRIEGTLEIEGKNVDFSEGIGYIEKDWGQSFPSSWIWMQTNHFDTDEPISLMTSVARIPWLGSHFVGFLVGFYFKGKLYRFATYTGAKMKATLGDNNDVKLSFKSGKNRLEIHGFQAKGADLVSPISGEMRGKVNESMQAEIEVQLFEKEQLIFSGRGRNAGMEIAGDMKELTG